MRSLAQSLAGHPSSVDPNADVRTLRHVLGFAEGVQQDASDALYALLEPYDLHEGVAQLEVTISLSADKGEQRETRRLESASVVMSVHEWAATGSTADTLDQLEVTDLTPPSEVGGLLVRRVSTRLVYIPGDYFVLHVDRSSMGQTPIRVGEEVCTRDGRTFQLHAAVLRRCCSGSSHHFTAVVRCAGHGWLVYDDLATSHPVAASLDVAAPGLDQAVVLAMYRVT
jgi:hypothetical protein